MLKAAVAALALGASSLAASAAELLMFEDRGCGYCKRWDAEIGPGYSRSAEGRRAPLRKVNINSGAPHGVARKRPVTITPTFVLVHHGREVGRVVGYPGAEFFYGALGDVMARMK